MRVVRLRLTTEVINRYTGRTTVYPRMSECWCREMEDSDWYICINNEEEYEE